MNSNTFLTCRSDKCFKCVYLDPKNVDFLRLITKDVTGRTLGKIKYLNVEKNTNIEVKRMYLDTLIESDDCLINFEVNSSNNSYVHPKSMSYNCLNYVNSIKASGKYTEDKDIIQVNLSYGLKDTLPIREYTINDYDKLFVKNFTIYEVNMDYFMNFWYNRNDLDNLQQINKYKYFIMLDLNLEELCELLKIVGKDERIEKFMKELERVNNGMLYKTYITEEEEIEFIKNTIRDEAKKEGIEAGRQEGIEAGRQEGIEQGIEQGIELEKVNIARNLLRENINTNIISNTTGLSIREINSIQV